MTRFAQFQSDIGRARDLVGLGQSIGSMTNGRVDASDMYRGGLVQAVAAMDAWVHGVVLDRAVSVLMGRLPSNVGDSRIGLRFGAVSDLLAAPTPTARELSARSHLAQRLSRETYQRPDDVAAALAMVGVNKVWTSCFSSAADAKARVGVVIDRRNRIVHSCDADPLTPGEVTPLTDADALTSIDTVDQTVTQISAYVPM